MFLFSLTLVNTQVYSTPGYVAEVDNSPEVTVSEELEEDSKSKFNYLKFILILLSFMAGVFFMRFLTARAMTKEKIKNHSQRKKDEDSSIGNHLEPRSTKGEDNTSRDMPGVVDNHADASENKDELEKEVDDFVNELELDEVTDKSKEVEKDEH